MNDNSERTAAIEKLNELIKDIRIAMLTTVDHDGTLRSRPMGTQQIDADGILWFFTSAASHKVDEMQDHHEVNASYADDGDNRYVSIAGTATISRDRQKIHELWSPMHKAWFPDGPDDPDIALIRVDVHSAEYWDAPSSAMVHVVGFVKAVATGRRYEPGENEKLDL